MMDICFIFNTVKIYKLNGLKLFFAISKLVIIIRRSWGYSSAGRALEWHANVPNNKKCRKKPGIVKYSRLFCFLAALGQQ